jgi:hypothetical protein
MGLRVCFMGDRFNGVVLRFSGLRRRPFHLFIFYVVTPTFARAAWQVAKHVVTISAH